MEVQSLPQRIHEPLDPGSLPGLNLDALQTGRFLPVAGNDLRLVQRNLAGETSPRRRSIASKLEKLAPGTDLEEGT